ncbi:MAG: M28 family peptidase, partial [Calditrichaeota bacterium]
MKRLIVSVLFLAVGWVVAFAQEPVDLEMISRIKAEGFQHSQVMETLFYLTDVNGPRLTNSPNFKAASEWCVKQLTDWGLVNARREAWGTFGKGWAVERFSAEMVEPQYLNLIAYPAAWTGSTDGTIAGQPVLIDVKSEEDLEQYKGKLAGAIVMTVPTQEVEAHFEADAKRYTDEDLADLAQAPEPGARPSWWARREEFRRRRALQRKLRAFFRDEGVGVVLRPSRHDDGTILVSSGGSYKMGDPPGVPQLVVAIEHYLRIVRLLQHDIPVKLEVNIQNKFFEEDSLGYNVVAEIPGVDKKLKSELVMLGGHLDSWHSGTGATDNAAGCAVAMEAVRILEAVHARPRRTIRIALW